MDTKKFINNMKSNDQLYKFIKDNNISDSEILSNAGKFLFVFENNDFELQKNNIISVVSSKPKNNEMKYLFAPNSEVSILEVKNKNLWEDDIRNHILSVFTQEYFKSKKGMYLFGEIGRGKTFISHLFVNILIKKEKYVSFINMSQVMDFILNNRDRSFIDRILLANYLFIDDIGSENNNDFYFAELFKIIDFRYQNNLPTYFTSNYSIEELVNKFAARDEIQAKKIVSRINEMTDSYKV